jgi:hypothetical protein
MGLRLPNVYFWASFQAERKSAKRHPKFKISLMKYEAVRFIGGFIPRRFRCAFYITISVANSTLPFLEGLFWVGFLV